MPEQSKHTVFDLFKQLGKGSERALAEIGHLYKKKLVRYIHSIVQNKELAKEIFSDTLQALWVNRKEVATMERPESWIITTAHNKAVNKVRDEKRNYTLPLQQFPGLESTFDIEAEMEYKELNRQLEIAEAKLSAQERLVFTLSKRHGLSRKEIAQQCDVSENTVRNQLRNAVKNLRVHLGKLTSMFLI